MSLITNILYETGMFSDYYYFATILLVLLSDANPSFFLCLPDTFWLLKAYWLSSVDLQNKPLSKLAFFV